MQDFWRGFSSDGAVTKYIQVLQGKHEDFLSVGMSLCTRTLIKLLSFIHSSSDLCPPVVFRSQICELSESCEVQVALLTCGDRE